MLAGGQQITQSDMANKMEHKHGDRSVSARPPSSINRWSNSDLSLVTPPTHSPFLKEPWACFLCVCVCVGSRPYIPPMEESTHAAFDMWAKSVSSVGQQYHIELRFITKDANNHQLCCQKNYNPPQGQMIKSLNLLALTCWRGNNEDINIQIREVTILFKKWVDSMHFYFYVFFFLCGRIGKWAVIPLESSRCTERTGRLRHRGGLAGHSTRELEGNGGGGGMGGLHDTTLGYISKCLSRQRRLEDHVMTKW